jgi:hypothetical protein
VDLTGYPDIDPAYKDTVRSDDKVYVEYDAQPNDDGELVIRRAVWSRGGNRRTQKILWIAEAVVIPQTEAPNLVRDIAASLL